VSFKVVMVLLQKLPNGHAANNLR